MKYLDHSRAEPAQNLAWDEALLLEAEAGGQETLRFWEPQSPFVVLGHASRVEDEVSLPACRAAGVPVLRRPSGGAAVVQAPGCLDYTVVLDIAGRGLGEVAAANAYVMERLRRALEQLVGATVNIEGFTDLTLAGRKFSGNSQYRKKRALLFHGSFLLDCDISLIEKLLLAPPRQPDYRRRRLHRDFLTNIHIPAAAVKAALREAWGAVEERSAPPIEKIEALIRERYARDEWNLRF
ncbi:MAG TPA: lipoate--protein ligase family protein [Candidatus Binatia bacterium]